MASGPHDIESSLDGSAVRYKVYPEKKRKAKIKLCVRFDPDDPKPEREWDQFRDDGDPEAAVRAAARRLLGGSAPTESVEAARATSERVEAERQAAADEEARQLQLWHAEKAVREAEQQAARDAAAAERAARWQAQQAALRKRLDARREEEAHAVCAAYHRGLAQGNEEVRKTLQVVDAYRQSLTRAVGMLQEERERGRRQAEQWEALLTQTLAIIRKSGGKRKARLPPAQAALPWTAGTAAKQVRRMEMREAREMAESLVSASDEAERESEREEREERLAPLRAYIKRHEGWETELVSDSEAGDER